MASLLQLHLHLYLSWSWNCLQFLQLANPGYLRRHHHSLRSTVPYHQYPHPCLRQYTHSPLPLTLHLHIYLSPHLHLYLSPRLRFQSLRRSQWRSQVTPPATPTRKIHS